MLLHYQNKYTKKENLVITIILFIGAIFSIKHKNFDILATRAEMI